MAFTLFRRTSPHATPPRAPPKRQERKGEEIGIAERNGYLGTYREKSAQRETRNYKILQKMEERSPITSAVEDP